MKNKEDLKNFIINYAKKNNSHLGSNLGVLELTLAIVDHYDLNKDVVIFDTGHQTLPYKIINSGIDFLNNSINTISFEKFQTFNKEKYNFSSNGHTGNSLGTAIGYCLANPNARVACVIGDAAFENNYILQALINIKKLKIKNLDIFIVVNNFSIDEYESFFVSLSDKETFFSEFGLSYFQIKDGHDLKKIKNQLDKKFMKNNNIFYVNTIKGNGLKSNVKGSHKLFMSENNVKNYLTKEVESKLLDKNTYLISCAMNLKIKNKNYIDVGINEELAFLISSGLIKSGKKVYLYIYSTFLERCIYVLKHNNLLDSDNLIVIVDRNGKNQGDGETHDGYLDILFLSYLKNHKIIFTHTKESLIKSLSETHNKTVFVKLPKDFIEKKLLIDFNNKKDALYITNDVEILKILIEKKLSYLWYSTESNFFTPKNIMNVNSNRKVIVLENLLNNNSYLKLIFKNNGVELKNIEFRSLNSRNDALITLI